MRSHSTEQEGRLSSGWLILAVAILLVSSMGCSLVRRFSEPIVRADSLGQGGEAQQVVLTTYTPWPTFTPGLYQPPTPLPTYFTPVILPATATATATGTPIPMNTPFPTHTATATAIPVPTEAPSPTNTPVPALAPTNTPVSRPPTATPAPTFTPTPSFAYQPVEIFEDQTTNHFLTGYVAIVNYQEIPIGGVKAVGIFEPGGQRYESPLSKWFFEGYSAPGDVIKTSSVKFEPGGIIDGTWSIHLEDEWGTRLSENVTIATEADAPRWFFVKFKGHTPPGGAIASAPSGSPRAIPTRGPTPARPYAPPPTATRTTSANWSFVSTRFVQDRRNAVAYGNIINNTGASQEIIYVTGLFYDNQGRTIAGLANTDDYLPLNVVPPGGTMPFELTVYTIRSVEDFELNVAFQISAETPRQDFELLDLEPSTGAGDYCLRGRLQNAGAQITDYLVVVAVLYNDDDEVINFGRYEAPSPEDVLGDEVMDFEICSDSFSQNVARYEVSAWGR